MEFFQGTKVSLSLTLYNTLEKVFNILNIKKKSVLFVLILKERKNQLGDLRETFICVVYERAVILFGYNGDVVFDFIRNIRYP